MKFKRATAALAVFLLVIALPFSGVAATPEEAAKLQSDLTPLGAEKAGNKDGTIPAWDGGYTTVWPDYRSGQSRPDPFDAEKPRLQITAQNMQQYADQLSDGVKALLQRFPSYRLDVYPTHRTAAAPQWLYDNTFKNATRARLVPDVVAGSRVEGAYGGIPFPIPRDGAQAMWNHLLAWHGEAYAFDYGSYVVAANGRPVLAGAGIVEFQYPYYYRDGSLDRFVGNYWMLKLTAAGPPFRVGEKLLAISPAGKNLQAWQYLVGQRRVRRAPDVSYDTPDYPSSGVLLSDEGFLFIGNLDRYDWKLVGKKEMFVPYNTQRFHLAKVNQVLGPRHLNPDQMRWELHRVWVVEATLAPGKRHVMPKRRFYLDEDSWQAFLSDGWDAGGQLWHVGHVIPVLAPEQPGAVVVTHVFYDLLKGGYAAINLSNEQQQQYRVVVRRPEDYFSPAALVSEGIR
ncbi:MAG: DUF1329 domain-containing protein [Burkholderiales bacterium]|jgi:hypothetical protein|nr:DUF1329 domain-containing protein [Burkholderiales bacterium]